MDPLLAQMILNRLGDGELPEAAADLVLAACEGPAELAGVLGGGPAPRPSDDGQLTLVEHPPGAYVASISVQGFRGIGPEATLELTPGPGLTLVVGRNGSGKSSFAEGLELLMTGSNSRWVNRTKVWTEGWQSLHFDGDTALSAQLQVDGQPGLMRLSRRWPHGAALTPGDCEVTGGDGAESTLDALGWAAALSRYRPFLSYNELGQMFDELKTMYDALSAILGLEDIDELQKALRDARLGRERMVKDLKAAVKDLSAQLAAVDDDRARTALAALGAKPMDLDAIDLIVEGLADDGETGVELATLRQLASLTGPGEADVEEALDALATARQKLGDLAGTDAARAASLAGLLETALRHDEHHADGDCPVCGMVGVIDDTWRAQATREVVRLSGEARAVAAAQDAVRAAQRRVAELLPAGPPPLLGTARELGLDPGPLEVAWERWAELREPAADADDAARVRAVLGDVRRHAGALAAAAREQFDQRQDRWRPIAKSLGEWLPTARAAQAAAERLAHLKAAEAWARDTADDLRAERLAPIADAAKANWRRLRQASNVSLEGFALRKAGNTRQAEVEVRVDGSDASAFGVMSQGELHALAVSVFLPRAGLAESPFRFMVIDDPVQSMDPAKVDGLARVLHEAAGERQVIVFTHDDRLPEAVRRLELPATVLEVTRRPRSLVEVRMALDPIERYVDDARALVRSDDVPAEVIERVVPGFCRHALEAGCVAAARRRRLARGEGHGDVEATVGRASTLYTHLALALFDDEAKGGQVLAAINSRYGKKAGDVVVAANKGVHETLAVDLADLVRDAGILARQLAELP